MLGMAVIQLATPPTLFDIEVWLRLGTAAAALILIPFSLELPTAVVAWIVAALVVGQLVYELAPNGRATPSEPVDVQPGLPARRQAPVLSIEVANKRTRGAGKRRVHLRRLPGLGVERTSLCLCEERPIECAGRTRGRSGRCRCTRHLARAWSRPPSCCRS